MTARFACETFLPAAPAAVFPLALNVDLHVGSMAASGESAVEARPPACSARVRMSPGGAGTSG
jgi:hypothetical protein